VDRRSEEIARLKHRIRELEADCGDPPGNLKWSAPRRGRIDSGCYSN
jgi:hypothetical protein